MLQDSLQTQLQKWLLRSGTSASAFRQVRALPLALGSDVGTVRSENQDRVAVLRAQVTRNRFFYVITLCDGMGGMSEGATCASMALATFLSSCIRYRDRAPDERLLTAARKANEAIFSVYEGRGGATLSAVHIDSSGFTTGLNVGDSRIYSLHSNKVEQLSTDDTLAGQFDRDNASVGKRNELLQYIGIGEGLEPHTVRIPGDRDALFLTSDGIHSLDKELFEALIKNSVDPITAAKRLMKVANWAGGRDNASIVVATPRNIIAAPNDDSGAVEVWDSFGDVQIIGVEKSGSTADGVEKFETSVVPTLVAGNEPARLSVGQGSARQRRKGKPGKKPKGETKRALEDQDVKIRPQLKIKFDNKDDGNG